MCVATRPSFPQNRPVVLGGSLILLAILCILPRPSDAGDADAGRIVFKKCAACHQLAPGQNRVGPSLHGVVGREAATAPGYRYSKALSDAGFAWTPARLNQWLQSPRKMLPGTRMAFPGLPKPEDRDNVIEYLEKASR